MPAGIDNNMGWSKWNSNVKAKYLGCLRKGMRRGAASRAAGISLQTVMRARYDDPSLAQEEAQAEADACEVVEDALLKKALEGNVTAIQVWLYNRCPDRWADRRNNKQEIQITNQPADIDALKKQLLDRLKPS
jgi:hypothetical protein